MRYCLLARLPALHEIHVWNSGLAPADLLALRQQFPKLSIDAGYMPKDEKLQINPPILVNENILLYTDKEVINESNSFTIQEDSIPLYRNEQDDTISYVDIEEFVAFLGGGLLNYNVFKEDTLLLDFRQVIPVDLVEVVGEEVVIYEVEFDHEENTIYASDLDIFTRLNLVHSISTNDFVNLSEIISNNENPEIVIDLDDYGFDVFINNGRYRYGGGVSNA